MPLLLLPEKFYPSLFLLIYGLTMGTGSVPNPAQFPPLVLTFPDLLSPLICLHKEDRIILSLSFPPLTWSHGHGSFGTLPLLTIHGNRGCCWYKGRMKCLQISVFKGVLVNWPNIILTHSHGICCEEEYMRCMSTMQCVPFYPYTM